MSEFEKRLAQARAEKQAQQQAHQAAVDRASAVERQRRAAQVQRALALVPAVREAVVALQQQATRPARYASGPVRFSDGPAHGSGLVRRLFAGSGRQGWWIHNYVFVPLAGAPVVNIRQNSFSLEEFARRGSVSYVSPGFGSTSDSTIVVDADDELDRVLQAIVDYLK